MDARICTYTTAGLVANTLIATPALAPAQTAPNQAPSFDGPNDLVIVSNRRVLALTDGAFELWFKPAWTPGSIASDPVLLANRQGSVLTGYSLHLAIESNAKFFRLKQP